MLRLLFLSFIAIFSVNAQAQSDMPRTSDLVSDLQSEELSFVDAGMLFGYETIEACIWANEHAVLIENYCLPKRNYPAESYILITRSGGLYQMYQEDFGSLLFKRIEIGSFPAVVFEVLFEDLSQVDLKLINQLLKYQYYENKPACWVKNYDFSTEKPGAGCYRTDLDLFPVWHEDAMQLTSDDETWEMMMNMLRSARQSSGNSQI